MKIGISAEWIGTKAGGLETYNSNLISALSEIDSFNQYHVYTTHKDALQKFSDVHQNFFPRYLGTNSRWIAIPFSLPWELMRRPVDIFHVTTVPPPFSPVKYILTIHDIIFILHPEWFPKMVRYRLTMLVSMGIKRALKIIAVSESTKKDLINAFGLDENQITVIHEGVDKRFHPIEENSLKEYLLDKYGITRKYVLYVGRFHARKNLVRLINAFYQFRKKMNTEIRLVLVGRDQYHANQVFQEIEKLNLENQVTCPGHVDDQDLPLLYNGAEVFIYPSLFEGFGLPPLEAMACGTPVIASNCTSLPEVLGDAAELIDPYDIEEMAQKIYRVISDEDLRNLMIERGFSRARTFSWETTARKTLEIYEEVFQQVK